MSFFVAPELLALKPSAKVRRNMNVTNSWCVFFVLSAEKGLIFVEPIVGGVEAFHPTVEHPRDDEVDGEKDAEENVVRRDARKAYGVRKELDGVAQREGLFRDGAAAEEDEPDGDGDEIGRAHV